MRRVVVVGSLGLFASFAILACVGDEPSFSTDGSDAGDTDALLQGDTSASGDGSTAGDSSGSSDSGADVATAPASCTSLASTCGQLANQDCCLSSFVDGGTFYRNYDGILVDAGGPYTDMSHTATLSSFKLDAFAVTVGRFRQFVTAYPGDLPASNGLGKNPHNGTDPGWSTTFNAKMPATATDLKSALTACAPALTTWTDTPDGGPEHKPINCVTWYEAYAFCIWDGARLPTAAEYNYAQSGGGEQRVYPWSSPPSSQTINSGYLVQGPSASLADVGSKLLGNGKYGQSDLVGNMAQWTLDTSAGGGDHPPASCNDCATFGGNSNVIRGSAYFEYGSNSRGNRSDSSGPTTRTYAYGFRCARDL